MQLTYFTEHGGSMGSKAFIPPQFEKTVFDGKSPSVLSFYQSIEKNGCRFYCVSCHKERHLTSPARVGSAQFYFHVVLTTGALMAVTWPWFGIKGIVMMVPVLAGFEILYRLKMRAALQCPDCSFDPILYLVDRAKAVQQVEEVWRKKFAQHGLPYPERRRTKLAPTVTKLEAVTPSVVEPLQDEIKNEIKSEQTA
jgi:hypothetical protein